MRTGSRPMKKLLFLGVGSALIFTMGGIGSAQADNPISPHMAGVITVGVNSTVTDRCSACHRAHTGQGADNLVVDQTQLCNNCHGAGGMGSGLDVQNGVETDSTPGALNAGGFGNAEIDSTGANKTEVQAAGSTPVLAAGAVCTTCSASKLTEDIPVLPKPVPTTSAHTVGIPGTEWGNGAVNASPTAGASTAITLQCASCHNPHGNGNYDILIPMPTAAVAAIGTTPAVAATTGVNIPDPTHLDATGKTVFTNVYTTTNYWLSGDSTVPADSTGMGVPPANPQVAYNNGATAPIAGVDGFIQDISAWCAQCHTRLMAPSGSASTASGDAMFTFRHSTNRNYQEVGGANCITCHVAHGSNAVMTTGGTVTNGVVTGGVSGNSSAVTLPGAPTPAGGNSYLLRVADRGTCLMCHSV
jgi:predicted CXXCH cytochrome family protein